jgi:hypothetical protein
LKIPKHNKKNILLNKCRVHPLSVHAMGHMGATMWPGAPCTCAPCLLAPGSMACSMEPRANCCNRALLVDVAPVLWDPPGIRGLDLIHTPPCIWSDHNGHRYVLVPRAGAKPRPIPPPTNKLIKHKFIVCHIYNKNHPWVR